MYRAAEEQIIHIGLTIGARVVLAFFSAFFGIVMFLVAPPTEKAALFYAFGGFCVFIALACVTSGRVRRFFGSVIGCTLFGLSLFYLLHELFDGDLIRSNRGEPSILQAIFFLLAFGIPGAAYAVRARFGIGK